MKRVTGIGGIFFKCKDPKATRAWYEKHLGFNTDEWGTVFGHSTDEKDSNRGFTQWSPMEDSTNYYAPSQKEFMLNYRVENLTWLVDQLKKEGINVLDNIESFPYGKFVHIMDLDGQKVELWEPNDDEFDKISGAKTK